jgi:hypothetical protein
MAARPATERSAASVFADGWANLPLGRHILEISYQMIRTGQTYQELGPDYFDRRHGARAAPMHPSA